MTDARMPNASKRIYKTRNTPPIDIPAMANPRPVYLLGSFLIFKRAINPVTRAAGASSNPSEQHHPIVILPIPNPNETIANVWFGDN